MSTHDTHEFPPHPAYDENTFLSNAAANELLRISGKPTMSLSEQLERIATKWNLDETQRASLRTHLAGGNPPAVVVRIDTEAAAALTHVIQRFSPEELGVNYKAWNRAVEALSPVLPNTTDRN